MVRGRGRERIQVDGLRNLISGLSEGTHFLRRETLKVERGTFYFTRVHF
jgi:hypothetical protein